MTIATIPGDTRPGGRRLWLIRGAAVAGALYLVGYTVALIAARYVPPPVPAASIWPSSAIYLASTGHTTTTCEEEFDSGGRVTLRIPGGSSSSVTGLRVDGSPSGPGTITCDKMVAVSSGPLLVLYPLARWSWMMLFGIGPLVYWWRNGRRRRQGRPRPALTPTRWRA